MTWVLGFLTSLPSILAKQVSVDEDINLIGLVWFFLCLVSLLGTYVLSCTHLAHSKFYYVFKNHISTSLSSLVCFYACLGSLLGTYVLSRTHLTHISYTSSTFQTFTMFSKIKFLPFLSSLEYFYACLGSLLSTYVLSRTHLAHSKLLLCVPISNFLPLLSSLLSAFTLV